MKSFVIGQRWISKMEPELGLGVVKEIHHKTVLLDFPAADCQRHYAKDTAPLQRVAFKSGDTVTSKSGQKWTVKKIEDKNGLTTYHCDQGILAESELCDTLSFSTPQDRLLSGLTDTNRTFNLRYQTLVHNHKIKKSYAHGFLGGRIDLLPHQLYIAHEVSRRPLPRVLLCDEVGLGKTIEACLILHRLLITGRVNRVLILVPESLVHQWFVELLRKFNLFFKLVNEDFINSFQGNQDSNPFLTNSIFLSSIQTLSKNRELFQHSHHAGWDLLVVDEAHHLTEGTPDYQIVETLGKQTPGLILLTATPQQLGHHSHFSRLRLLDPDRYHDFDAFEKERDTYQEIAELADKLLSNDPLTKKDETQVTKLITNQGDSDWDKEILLQKLLDRHGMGRVLFRNTRSVIKSFPQRRRQLVTLDSSKSIFKNHLNEFQYDVENRCPDHYDYTNDPRIHWLSQWLKSNPQEKALLICKNIQKVEAINQALKNLMRVETALFHEKLTLIQRDKNAAWFARKKGARILICSEIGSEGRNFQFAHHLILFDLPLNPELLEQRIGRLDRIGQKENIHIHIPVVKGSPQDYLAQWYHQGLGAFENNLADGYEIFQELGVQLKSQILNGKNINTLISKTRDMHQSLQQKMAKGRDRLLELHSFNPQVAEKIIQEITHWDQEDHAIRFTTRLFSHFGIRLEEVADRTYRFHFDLLENPDFPIPPLRESKLIGTFDRTTANQREEIEFLTWDHPMLTGAVELLIGSDNGNCAIAIWSDTDKQALLLETIFLVETVASPELFCNRFLPATPVRVVVDNQQMNQTDAIPAKTLQKNVKDAPPLSSKVKSMMADALPPMLTACTEIAEKRMHDLIQKAEADMKNVMNNEIDRLVDLKAVNPNIRDQEILKLRNEKDELTSAIQSARLRLDSVRLILTS